MTEILNGNRVATRCSSKCPRQESNLNLEFRKPLFYPLNYGGGFAGQAGR